MGAFPSAIPGRYSILNEQEFAGSTLIHLRDNLIFPEDELATGKASENTLIVFDQIAERVPAGSGRVIFAPWLYGERTPIENSTVRGGFFNVSLDTKREHLVRAMMEELLTMRVGYSKAWRDSLITALKR